jgi:hypothetical protein
VRLDEIFAPEDLPERDEFVTVELPDEDCFPRLVVGNFHRDGDSSKQPQFLLERGRRSPGAGA